MVLIKRLFKRTPLSKLLNDYGTRVENTDKILLKTTVSDAILQTCYYFHMHAVIFLPIKYFKKCPYPFNWENLLHFAKIRKIQKTLKFSV